MLPPHTLSEYSYLVPLAYICPLPLNERKRKIYALSLGCRDIE